MPKPRLKSEAERLMVADIIETLLAGHKQYRPDLAYPESHSDMTGAVYGLILKYEVKLRPLPKQLEYEE